jgi:hypothetical protein
LVAAFTLGFTSLGTTVGAISSKPPPGYRTVVVKEAGITIAAPKSWVVLDPGRTGFNRALRKLRKTNAQLADTFMAQEQARLFFKQPALYLGDPAGEKFHDNASVLNIRGVTETPTEDQIRDALSGLPNVETKPTTVAGVDAIEAAYETDVNIADGETLTTHVTQYAFLGKKGGVAITFTGLEDGRQNPRFQKMLASAKLRR